MNAILINHERITPNDLCLDVTSSHVSIIEYWFIHEIKDECDQNEAAELEKIIVSFAECKYATRLEINTSIGHFKIEKI